MLPLKDDTKIALLLACTIFLVYLVSLSADFSFIDDPVYVYKNPLVTGFQFIDILSKRYFAAYIPVTILSYALEYLIWGNNPFGYHLTNIIFHALNAILVYFIILRLTKERFVSFFTAMVFAIHPLQVQSVVWISERKSILSLFFMMLSFWYYIDFKEKKSGSPFLKSFIFFLLSILSKPVSVTYFILLICYDNFILKESLKKTVYDKIPFILVSALVTLVTIISQSSMGAVKPYHGGSFYTNLITIPKGFIHYFKTIFYPKDLLFYYDFKPALSIISPSPLIGIAVVLILLFVMLKSRKENGIFSLGIAIFFIFLLPVSGIIPIEIITADRYMYIPIIGLTLSFIWFIKDHISRFRSEFFALSLFTIVLLSSVTISDSYLWKNKEGIWEEILNNSPDNMRAINNLVELSMAKGDDERAASLLGTGLNINDRNPRLLKNYALYSIRHGNNNDAHSALRKALTIDSNDKELYLESAKLYYIEKKYKSALKAIQNGIKIKYEFPLDTEMKYRFVLANIYVKLIMFNEAVDEFGAILEETGQYFDTKNRYDHLMRYLDDFNKYSELYKESGKLEYSEKLRKIFSNLNVKEEGENYIISLGKSK